MLTSLITAAILLLPRPATDDAEEQRAQLRQALVLLGQMPQSQDVADAYEDLHRRSWGLGDIETAHAAVARWVAWWEGLDEGGGVDHTGILSLFARRLDRLRDGASARALHERALALREEASGDGPAVRESLNDLANVLMDQGDYQGCLALYERALRITEAFDGPEHLNYGLVLSNVAHAHARLGDPATARPLYERALRIVEASVGPDHVEAGIVLLNLGLLLVDLGNLEAARPLFERVLAIDEMTYGPVHPLVAVDLNQLGTVHRRLGEYDEARALHERALAIQEEVLGPASLDVSDTLQDLANLDAALGDYAAARTLHERAIEIREAVYGPESIRLTTDLGNLADILRALGELDAARSLTQRVLAIREAVLGAEHPRVARTIVDLALLHLDAGDAEGAQRLASQLAERRGRVRRTLASLTPGEGHLYLANQVLARDTLLSTSAAVGDIDAAYVTVLHDKGQLARLTLQTRAQIRATLDPEALALTEELGHIQGRLARLAMEAEVPDRQAHDTLLDALRSERDERERELWRRADLGEQAPPTPQELAGVLPPGSAVVDLLAHAVWIPATSESIGHWSELRMSAWVLRAGDREVRHVDLGPVSAIEAATAAFLAELVGDGADAATRGGVLGRRRPVADANASLRQLVWDPLVEHLQDVDTVFLSPDGVLGTLPFGTLRDADGRYLIESHAFVYPTEVASMVQRPADVPALADQPHALLAVGGVDFRERADLAPAEPTEPPPHETGPGTEGDDRSPLPAAVGLRGGIGVDWEPLPATASESRAVAALHASLHDGGAAPLLLQGAHATEERLKVEMGRHGMVHLATHGYFQPDGLPSMRQEALDARDGGDRGGPRMSETASRLTGLHPGLLSGLVLAGADQPDGTNGDRDDGYLTASEVTLLDLSGTDLVVLSACETGLGRPASGEGLLGLRRAFHMAGAATVVSSLWAVEDESTSALMQAFYVQLLEQGMGRNEALRAAQLAQLERNRATLGDARPRTWGAFVLSGEWR